MKKLTKLLLINWHYIDYQLLEFENINFLTGNNGAGKSTIIDAIQLLLLGNPKGNYFNKAANDKAGRTLEGYLKGEMGDDGSTGFNYKREGRFTSYIAIEFFDKTYKKSFVIGVVFDVYKDRDFEYKFFSIDKEMPENHFIKDNIPLSIKDLKNFLHQSYGTKNYNIYASNSEYQTNILREIRWIK